MNLRRTLFKLQRFWKRTLPQSLLGRSLLILVLPFFLTIAIGLFVFFDRHWTTTTYRLVDSLAGEVAMVNYMWDANPTPEARAHLKEIAEKKMGLLVRYYPDKRLTYSKSLSVPGIDKPLQDSLNEKLDARFIIRSRFQNDTNWIVISSQTATGILTILVPQKRLFSTTTYVFLLFMIGSGLILSVVAFIFMRNQIRPVRTLALAAEYFGKGIDVPRFKATGAKEVRMAANAFLEMRDRIKRQLRQRTDMLSGVSHDLRTPLTRLKLQLAMLPQSADTTEMANDIAAMERMIKGYLDFARDETLEYALRCDLVDLLQQAVQDAAKQNLDITANLPDTPIILTIRPQAIQRVFTNILDNMRLYGRKGWVSLDKLSRTAEIIFDDCGPGIPPEQREDVFKPFHRLDASRNQDIEGTGLGLSIARDIVQSHGGIITLNDSPQGGLRVTIRLPL